MNQSATSVTQKGQVTIPVSLRKKFNIEANSRVRISEGSSYIKIEPINDVKNLAGSLYKSSQKSLSVAALRKIRKDGLIYKINSK